MRNMVLDSSVESVVERPKVRLSDQAKYDQGNAALMGIVKGVDSGKNRAGRIIAKGIKDGELGLGDIDLAALTKADSKEFVYGVSRTLSDDVERHFSGYMTNFYENHKKVVRDGGEDDDSISIFSSRDFSDLAEVYPFLASVIRDFALAEYVSGEVHYKLNIEAQSSPIRADVLKYLDDAVQNKRVEINYHSFTLAPGLVNAVRQYYRIAMVIPVVFYKQFGRHITAEEFSEILRNSKFLVGLLSQMHLGGFTKFDERASVPFDKSKLIGRLALLLPEECVIGDTERGLAIGFKDYPRSDDETPQLGCPFSGLNKLIFELVVPNLEEMFRPMLDEGDSNSYVCGYYRLLLLATDMLSKKKVLKVSEEDQTEFDLSRGKMLEIVEQNRDVDALRIAAEVRRKVEKSGCPYKQKDSKKMNPSVVKPTVYGVASSMQSDLAQIYFPEFGSVYQDHKFETGTLIRWRRLEEDLLAELDSLDPITFKIVIDQLYMELHYFFCKDSWYDYMARGKGDEKSLAFLDFAAQSRLTQHYGQEFIIVGGLRNSIKNYFSLIAAIPVIFVQQFGRKCTFEEFVEIMDSIQDLTGILAQLHFDKMIAYETSKAGGTRVGRFSIPLDKGYVIGRKRNNKLGIMPRCQTIYKAYEGEVGQMPQVGCPFKGLNRRVYEFIRPNMLEVFADLEDPDAHDAYLSRVSG